MRIRLCGCDHLRYMHRMDPTGHCRFNWTFTPQDGWHMQEDDACHCDAYSEAVIDPAKRRRGRGAAKRGKAAEIRRVAGPGRPDVLTEGEAIEVYVHAVPGWMRQKMAQAVRLRSGRTAVLRIEDPADKYTLEIVEA